MAKTTKTGPPKTHAWRFFRAGGFDQVRLDSAEDILALARGELDQKLWVALACPTKGLEFDEKTMAHLDLDKDGRIRAPEVIAATAWACGVLKNPGDLLAGAPALPLSAIDDRKPEGKRILASARQLLADLGKKDAAAIGPEDTADTARIFAQTRFNGDGVIPEDSADDAEVRKVLEEMLACVGSVPDRSGKPGVDGALVERFFAEAEAFAAWAGQAEGKGNGILVLGAKTGEAFAALQAVRGKIDDWFQRCRLAAYDKRAVEALNPKDADLAALFARDLSGADEAVSALPLARVEAGAALALEAVNPAWAAGVARLRKAAIEPLLGARESLSAADWEKLKQTLAGYEAWLAARQGAAVESLGLPRVRQILAGPARKAIAELLAKDRALEPEAGAIATVDKLVLLYRDLNRLLNNFVSFRDFYGRREKAVFQAGTLYLDQRTCDLCLRVEDQAKHGALAGLAKTYLAYLDCTRPSGEKMTIAAAFTGGDADNLMVGRNGVFYDRKGRDWDATITKVIDNPISIRQAFWSPYKRFVRMIEEQVAKRAAAAEAASQERMQSAAASVATADQKPAQPAGPKKLDIGVVAALGVAVGAIGTAVTSLVTGLVALETWKIPLVFIGLLLAISLPSVVIAWLKLRQRNLGPILDAGGWAINARAKINIPFGGSLTSLAALPPGAQRDLRDPYAPPKSFTRRLLEWLLVLILLAAGCWALWNFGVVDRVWPDNPFPKSQWVLEHPRQESPAKAPENPETPKPPTGE